MQLQDTPKAGAALMGVGRRDATPPIGIYARMWGAANHDVSEGTHRPLNVTALVFRASKAAAPLVLISLDAAILGDLGSQTDDRLIMAPLLKELKLAPEQVMVSCSHTHAAPWAATSRARNTGGELIAPYLGQLGAAILQATREALLTAAPAIFDVGHGALFLATNRDLPDPDKKKNRIICGYNPAVRADDTVLIGRVTRQSDGRVLATLVNYACHPTTLAWENRLISPDFIGGMREVVECHTDAAPCLFLQGASGELSPAHQYVGDHKVADQHGRQLGFAALSALESMLPPGEELAYTGVKESGAPLAVWLPRKFKPSTVVEGICAQVPLPLRPRPKIADLEKEAEGTTDRAMRERLFRRMTIVKNLGEGKTFSMPAWVWRIGQSLIIGQPNEPYSEFQVKLRAAFPDYAVIVMNVVGAEFGYLYPPKLDGQNIYQVWQSPFSKQSLPTLIKTCVAAGRKLTGAKSQAPMQTQILDVAIEFHPQALVKPLQLSSGLITNLVEARAAVTVETIGRRATGHGSIYLSDLWAWPSPHIPSAQRVAALRALCEKIARELHTMCGNQPAHPLELGLHLHEAIAETSGGEQEIPILARAMCASPFDAAIHDAAGLALQRSAFSFYDSPAVLPSADRWFEHEGAVRAIRGIIREHPLDALDAWWVVSRKDSLQEDVLPAVQRGGYRCFKIKLLGKDNADDVARTIEVFRTLRSAGVERPVLSVDTNEANPDAESVRDYLQRLRGQDPQAYAALAYLEQPTGRDIEQQAFDWHGIHALKPVLLDEGLTSLALLPVAKAQGWSGLALKTCKGHSFALVAAAWAFQNGMALTMQDLTNPGYAAIHAALMAAHIPTLNGVELNSPQYTPAANAPWLARYSGLLSHAPACIASTHTWRDWAARRKGAARKIPGSAWELAATQVQENRQLREICVPHTIRVGAGPYRGITHEVVQRAIDDVAQRGGGTVEIPKGVYHMRNALHLRSGVDIVGARGAVLRKVPSIEVPITSFLGYGLHEFTVAEPKKFAKELAVGQGALIVDKNAGGFYTTVGTIVRRVGDYFYLDRAFHHDYLPQNNARVQTVHSLIEGVGVENVSMRGLTLDGNPQETRDINGCRGGGVFLLRSAHVRIEQMEIVNFKGDAVSFQQCRDIHVTGCKLHHCSGSGLHPGSGSVGYVMAHNHVHHNGRHGLFYCLRTTHSHCHDNYLTDNRLDGISVGERDTDHLIENNVITGNGERGVNFRPRIADPGDRTILRNNQIGPNCRIRGEHEIFLAPGLRDVHVHRNGILPERGQALHVSAGCQRISFAGNTVVRRAQRRYDVAGDQSGVQFTVPRKLPAVGPQAIGKDDMHHLQPVEISF